MVKKFKKKNPTKNFRLSLEDGLGKQFNKFGGTSTRVYNKSLKFVFLSMQKQNIYRNMSDENLTQNRNVAQVTSGKTAVHVASWRGAAVAAEGCCGPPMKLTLTFNADDGLLGGEIRWGFKRQLGFCLHA